MTHERGSNLGKEKLQVPDLIIVMTNHMLQMHFSTLTPEARQPG